MIRALPSLTGSGARTIFQIFLCAMAASCPRKDRPIQASLSRLLLHERPTTSSRSGARSLQDQLAAQRSLRFDTTCLRPVHGVRACHVSRDARFCHQGKKRNECMKVHLVNPSHVSFGTAVITPRWLYVIAGATPAAFGDPDSRRLFSARPMPHLQVPKS